MILLKILPISCNKGHKYCLSLPINVQEKEIRGEGGGKILIIIDSLRIRILKLYLFLTQDRDASLCTINTWESLVIRQQRGQDFAWARPSIRKMKWLSMCIASELLYAHWPAILLCSAFFTYFPLLLVVWWGSNGFITKSLHPYF